MPRGPYDEDNRYQISAAEDQRIREMAADVADYGPYIRSTDDWIASTRLPVGRPLSDHMKRWGYSREARNTLLLEALKRH
ncbi:MAG: hypothetical protein P8Y47_02315 [Alphaproteobacteria bacterium]